MVIFNRTSFPNNFPAPELRLVALGFGKGSDRSGGLKQSAILVTLPAGAYIIRVHDGSKPLGPWWFTPWEYCRIADHFGLSGQALMRDRSMGRPPCTRH